MKKTLFFVLAVLLLASCERPGNENGNNHSDYNIIKNAVTDIDGNTYDAVKIGNQVWMAENLKTTRYANGDTIPQGNGGNQSEAYPFRYYPDNNIENVDTYGCLYNWFAVMHDASSSDNNPSGVQGICPDGWHVPSDAEWTELTDYVASQSEDKCEECEECIAKALASTTGRGNNSLTNNVIDFLVTPAGLCCHGSFIGFGYDAFFWSATRHAGYSSWYRFLSIYDFDVNRSYDDNDNGYSVRCLRD